MNLDDFMVYDDDDTTSTSNDNSSVHYDNGTEEFLTKYFSEKNKLGKDGYTVYKGKKSLTGSLIKQSDKVVQALLVNAVDAINTKFISVTFRTITEREIKKVTKKYISLDNSRRIPLLVERKYMEQMKYSEHRQKIAEQFL